MICDKYAKNTMNKILNIDCLEHMRKIPDNFYDLCLTDPPYGINESGGKFRGRKGGGHRVLEKKNWDKETPSKEVFDEIFRISKNQIIWGANYFTDKGIPPSMGWIYWDKMMGGDFSDGELAFTSFSKALKSYSKCNKMGGKKHPTQKALEIIEFSLEYAKVEKHHKVFDPFMGSGTTAVVCQSLGLEWCGCELEADYVEIANNRLEKVQGSLF